MVSTPSNWSRTPSSPPISRRPSKWLPRPTPMWGCPPHLLALGDGRLLCTYGYRRAPFGVRACLSHDGGETWEDEIRLTETSYVVLGMLDTKIQDWALFLSVANVSTLSVNPNTPYKSVDDLISAMKAKPGQVSVATAGINSSGHSAVEAFTRALGVTYQSGELDAVAKLAPDIVIECTGAPPVIEAVLCDIAPDSVICLAGVGSSHRGDFNMGLFNRNMVLNNGTVFGTVNANREYFELGVKDFAHAESEYPGWLASLLTNPIQGLDQYEELTRPRGIRALGVQRGGNIPAIALTAFARTEDRTRVLQAGFLVHVSKPVEPGWSAQVVASEKDGFAHLTMTRGDNTIVVITGDHGETYPETTLGFHGVRVAPVHVLGQRVRGIHLHTVGVAHPHEAALVVADVGASALDVDFDSLRLDTAIAAYLVDPADDQYLLEAEKLLQEVSYNGKVF